MKYLRVHPVARLTIAGGPGKITKLAQGALDLHSGRSQVDFARLAETAETAGARPLADANTALAAFEVGGPVLAAAIARGALGTIRQTLRDAAVEADVMIVDRQGQIIAHEREA